MMKNVFEEPESTPSPKQGFTLPKKYRLTRLIISIILSVLCLGMLLELHLDRATIIGIFASAVLTIVTWLHPGERLIELGDSLISRLLNRLRSVSKPKQEDIIIVYRDVDQDYLWAGWAQRRLEREGFSVKKQPWDGAEKYRQKMRRAAQQAQRVIIILSPHYEKMLIQQNAFQDFIHHDSYSYICMRTSEPRAYIHKDKNISSLNSFSVFGKQEDVAWDALNGACSGITPSRPFEKNTPPPELPYYPGGDLKRIWNLPLKDVYFTDRSQILDTLHNNFQFDRAQEAIKQQSITGLSGIGKTAIAIAYAYDERSGRYQYGLWLSFSSDEMLRRSLERIAKQIIATQFETNTQAAAQSQISTEVAARAETNIQKGKRQVGEIKKLLDENAKPSTYTEDLGKAITRWLGEQTRWLLVFDHCDTEANWKLANKFIPAAGRGDVLFTGTTRSLRNSVQIMPEIITRMSDDEGARLLLSRAKQVPSDNNLRMAEDISHAAGGLPGTITLLGVDIYKSNASLQDYLKRFKENPHKALQMLEKEYA